MQYPLVGLETQSQFLATRLDRILSLKIIGMYAIYLVSLYTSGINIQYHMDSMYVNYYPSNTTNGI